MKIGNSPELDAYNKLSTTRKGASGTQGSTTAAPASTAAKSAGAGAVDGSQVALSSQANALMSGVQGDDGSFDAEKVQRISDAIAKGQFTYNPDAIADKLISNTAELVGRTPSQSH